MQNIGHVPDQPFDQAFGEYVRAARQARGLSQAELAQRLADEGLRLDPSAVTRIERGQRAVKLEEGLVIARALGDSLARMAAATRPVHGWEHLEVAIAQAEDELAGIEDAVGTAVVVRQQLRDALGILENVRAETGAADPKHAGAMVRYATELDVLLSECVTSLGELNMLTRSRHPARPPRPTIRTEVRYSRGERDDG